MHWLEKLSLRIDLHNYRQYRPQNMNQSRFHPLRHPQNQSGAKFRQLLK
jgi:hypothetical protein